MMYPLWTSDDLPAELDPGVTVGDLSHEEIRDRAMVLARLLVRLEREFESFVGHGFPVEQVECVMRELAGFFDYWKRAFRGAREWRSSREEALREAIASGALSGPRQAVPAHVTAAFWCDVAIETHDALKAAIARHADELQSAARRADQLRSAGD